MSPQRPIDRALDEYLQDRSALSRVYKETADENPPEDLDTAILAQARRATKGKTGAARSPFARNWMIPASLAAVLILTVGLVTFMFEEGAPLSPKISPEPALESSMEEELPGAKRNDALEAAGNRAVDMVADKQASLKRKRGITAAPAPVAEDTALMKREAAPAEQKATPAKVPERTAAMEQEAAPIERQIAAAEPPKKSRAQALESSVRDRGVAGQQESAGEKDEQPRAQDRLGESSVAASRVATESKEHLAEESFASIGELLGQGKAAEAYEKLAALRERYLDDSLPFEPAILRISVDGERIEKDEIVTLRRGQSVRLKVEVIHADGSTTDVTNHPFTIIASRTPLNLAVSDTGRVTAPLDKAFSKETRGITIGFVDIWYGFKRDTDERLNEIGSALVQFELID